MAIDGIVKAPSHQRHEFRNPCVRNGDSREAVQSVCLMLESRNCASVCNVVSCSRAVSGEVLS